MKISKIIKNEKGQALSEMVLSIPLLFLFAAGIIQFSIIFLSYIQFEHACGEAARQYAAGIVEKNSIEPCVWRHLNYFGRFFDRQSLSATLQAPRSGAGKVLDHIQTTISIIPGTLNYDGAEWNVKIRCRPPFLFSTLFPNGIIFKTDMHVLRYPK